MIELRILRDAMNHKPGCPFSKPEINKTEHQPKADSVPNSISTLATPLTKVCNQNNQLWYYDPKFLERDIKLLLNRKFKSRSELIDRVRNFGSQRGFNICIPRGDIVLQDGTLQTTLYCHKYGIKRKRAKETPKSDNSKEDGRCLTKKTNCPFRLKFIKRNPNDPEFEFFEAIHHHNHPLIVMPPTPPGTPG